ncbi:unnamed protein product [Caenorhabditis bovis]|uniref:ZMIZ1 N-terminal domain-containing protein n=1 Tax=Caenorhabditis bovis TaxID=2654633 RepID=A0A8S1F9U6_9PELO|nr:unnamed protein product [Caenorhabditis bovis]
MGEVYGDHVSFTISRLYSIREQLSVPETFTTACLELTRWCSDQRAFTPQYEENLLLSLQDAMEHGTKETGNFDLTQQLMTTCFQHRKHLSKPSATRISRWHEQLRRLKKNGGKRRRAPARSTATATAAAAGPVPVAVPIAPNQIQPMLFENSNINDG